jgi:hypothetical protein
MIPPIAVRLRRDVKLLLNLIRTHALLHQASRTPDAEGRLIATLDDYAAVYALVSELIAEGVHASVPASVRETVEAVTQIADRDGSAMVQQVARTLKLDNSAASHRCSTAKRRGYVRNEETSRGRPARYVPDAPLPSEQQVLPRPDELRAALGRGGTAADDCTIAVSSGGDTDNINAGEHPRQRRRIVL